MNEARIVLPDGDPDLEKILRGSDREQGWAELGGLQVHVQGALSDGRAYVERIGSAEGVILGWNLPAGVISACENLKIISFLGTGVANFVDLEEAAARGVTVTNTPNYGDAAVAEHTIALMLAALRRVSELDGALAEGRWLAGRGSELTGKTVGVVGLGGIGTYVARLLNAFGCRVVCWTRTPSANRMIEAGVEFVELDELFEISDVVSLHLLLTAQTRGLVDADLLDRMRPGALLVNTARAELVDEERLFALLRAGRLVAAVDVFSREPLPAENQYRGVPGLLMTPHIGYDTPEALDRMMEITLRNFVAFFGGDPINVVTTS